MAGNTLNRPLFKMGPQGDMRPQMISGGVFNPKNWRLPWPRPGTQGEMFNYKPGKPIHEIDDLGQVKTIGTQTVTPKKRYDINANIWGQDMDTMFYSNPLKGAGTTEKFPPIFEKIPGRTETDLFGGTTTVGESTKVNLGNIFAGGSPINFRHLKLRWNNMSPERRKMIVRNLWGQPTAWAIVPSWLKLSPEAQAIQQEDVGETLEELGLPTPAISMEEVRGGRMEEFADLSMKEFVDIADADIKKKEEQIKEERQILDSSSTSALTVEDDPVTAGEKNLGPGVKGEAEKFGTNTGEVTTYDLLTDYLNQDTEVSAKGVAETKAELKALMGDESKMMNTMMLMQLGLSMMSGTSNQTGLSGFLDIASKAGKEILPIAMQNLANKSKMDKELSLAAYDIVREEQQAKGKRMTDIQDYYMEQFIKKSFETPKGPEGTLRNVMKKNVIQIPGQAPIITWQQIDQVFDKGPVAAKYLEWQRVGSKELGLAPGDVVLSSDMSQSQAQGGMDPFGGTMTKSQRGEALKLASVLEAALPDAINLQMNPVYGLHTGKLKTGFTGTLTSMYRTGTMEVKQLAQTFGIPEWLIPAADNAGFIANATMKVLSEQDAIYGGGMANTYNPKTGNKDIYHGEGIGPDGVLVTDDFATDIMINNLINQPPFIEGAANPAYDIVEQLENRMGFLNARVKQPTGRLLADTIKSSIAEVQITGGLFEGVGGPEQVAHRLHQFTKDLYQNYIRQSMLGGTGVTQSWAVDPNIYGQDRVTIDDYQNSYYRFIGGSQNTINLPIDNSWLQMNQKIKSAAATGTEDADATIDITGSVMFGNTFDKWLNVNNQQFGEKTYTGQ